MVPCSRRNLLRSAGYHDLDEFGDSKQGTPAPSNTGSLDAPVPDALVPAPAPTKYTEEALQTMTMFCMDLFPQAQASRPKPPGH